MFLRQFRNIAEMVELLTVYLAMSEAVTKALVFSCSVKQDSITGQECRDTLHSCFFQQ